MRSDRTTSIVVKVLLAALLLAGISAGCGGPSAEVEVERIGPRVMESTIMVAGSLQASNPVQVIPQVYGTVAQVFAQDGQQVAAGQPIVQLDTSNLEQALLSARASLESIQSIASAFNGMTSLASSLGGTVNQALATVESSVNSLVQLTSTVLPTILPALVPDMPEDQRLAALQALAGFNQQVESLQVSMPSVDVSGGGGYSTGAQEAAANKSIENAQKNLQAATIAAPAAGVLVPVSTGGASIESLMGSLMSSFGNMIPSGLSLSSLTGMTSAMSGMGMPTPGMLAPGSFVLPGSPIYTIVDLKNMTMVAKVDETDIAKVAPNQPASLVLEAYPGEKFTGTVVKVANTSTTNEAGATAFDVTIQLQPPNINLKIGMTGTADVVVATKQDAMVVPVEAVMEKKGKKYVFKVVDGKARLTEITVGLTTESSVEIVDGVEFGDKVVVEDVEKLKDGQGVKI